MFDVPTPARFRPSTGLIQTPEMLLMSRGAAEADRTHRANKNTLPTMALRIITVLQT
jgi:hypothetical protein